MGRLITLAGCLNRPFDTDRERVRIFSCDNERISLAGMDLDLFEAVSRKLLLDNGLHEKYSEQYLNHLLIKILVELQKNPSAVSAKSFIENLISEFKNYAESQTVYIPLAGIHLQVDGFKIGKIKLVNVTGDKLSAMLSTIDQINSSKPNNEEKFSDYIRQEFTANMKDAVCAEFTIIAEPERAVERAVEETRQAIDILRYTQPALYHESYKVSIGLRGEVFRISHWVPIITNEEKNYQMHDTLIGPLIPFTIDRANITVMVMLGAFRLSELLAKPNKETNEYEKALLRAVHWYATSQTHFELENKFLNLIMSLETLLTPRDGNPIGTAIAEAVALLLVSNVDRRRELKKRVKELYSYRSAVSHGGNKSILYADVKELEAIVSRLINKLLINFKEKFKSVKEFLDWIESVKLSGRA